MFGAARLRLGRGDLELQGHHGPLRQDHLAALLPPGDGDARQRAGDHRRDLPRRRRPGLRPDPVGPEDALRAGQRGQAAVSVRPGQGGRDPQGPRLARRPQRDRRPAPTPAAVPTSAAPAFPPGRRSRSTGTRRRTAAGPYISLTDEAVTSEAKQAAGINIRLHQKTFNYIASNFNDADPSVAKFTNTWAVENFSGYTDSPYPTQNSIFNTGGSFNSGAYTDPKMDKLINASVFGSDPNAVTNEASYETDGAPGAVPAQLRLHLGRLKAGRRGAGLVPQPDAVRALAAVLVGQQEVGGRPRTAGARSDARIHHPPDPRRDRDHDRDRGDHVRAAAPDRR